MIDKAGRSMELEDVSAVEKFEISEESYAQRKGKFVGIPGTQDPIQNFNGSIDNQFID